jgi:GT2 family glycosyltransferase
VHDAPIAAAVLFRSKKSVWSKLEKKNASRRNRWSAQWLDALGRLAAVPSADRITAAMENTIDDSALAASDRRVPVARVVIPAYRAARTIRDCVCAVLGSSVSADCEIVVVDDGENGRLNVILAGLPVAIVSAFSGSAAAARNLGAKHCMAPWLVFIDADVIVEPCCLDRLLAPLCAGRADATVGNYSRNVAGLCFGTRYKQLYIACVNERRHSQLNTFWTAIGAVDARAFAALRGFDTDFKGANGEDAELGARLSATGFRIAPVLDALGQHRHPLTLRQLIANDWRKGIVAMRHYQRNNGALSDNCHATRRDKIAVGMASVLPALITAMPLAGEAAQWLGLGMGASVMLYLAARGDLLRIFGSSGVSFVVKALPLMFALDWLRGGCVVVSMLSHPSPWRVARRGRLGRAAAGEHAGG